ncbi:MAG: hypothetical protein U9R41_03750 [Candidatus Marinimicrobia bacterium]|nr:hypothetical protein [Candidatus Neomarinimicrobiota bacterium]
MKQKNINKKDATKLAVFRKKEIRRTIYNNEWWFVINDIIAVLTNSSDPAQYFKRMKLRDGELKKLTEKGGVQFVPPLRLSFKTVGGNQKMYCWNTEGILSDSANPREYWYKMKIRVKDEDEFELSTICRQLKLQTKSHRDCMSITKDLKINTNSIGV